MFIYSRKGQIFPVIIAIISILIIAALISANVGKVSLSRLGCINGADGGATAGISAYVCGYNKIAKFHTVMKVMYWTMFAAYLYPVPVSCYPLRHVPFTLFNILCNNWYSGCIPVIETYSYSVRQDAYYYALVNANIDDPYKEDGTRYPPLGQWTQWSNLKSAFDVWINNLGPGWQDASSQTYNWYDGSSSLTVSCSSSSYEQLRKERGIILGLYYGVIPCLPLVPVPLPHGLLTNGFKDPSLRWVNITVQRRFTQPEKDLGFWKTYQRNSQATARATMTGGWGGWDYTLN